MEGGLGLSLGTGLIPQQESAVGLDNGLEKTQSVILMCEFKDLFTITIKRP